jgi:anti-sigma B factor antagonist
MRMPLTTSVLYDDDVALISLAGELDLTVAPLVDAAVTHVLDDGLRRVLLDLDALRFCDSSGLGALLRAARRVREAGGTCVVAAARGPVSRLLDLTGMEQALRVSPEVQPALQRLRQASAQRSSEASS